jgi:hypothetical protein
VNAFFWKLLTDVVVVVHGAWVVTVSIGPIWGVRYPRFRAVHLGMMWWTFFVLASGMYCPVSGLENSFRVHYDPSSSYSGGFVVHYVNKIMNWDLTQPHIVSAMTAWAFLWTGIYIYLWLRNRKKTPPAAGPR